MNRAQQVEKIVGDHAHLEPGLVRLETPAARLVPPQRILALFDTVRGSPFCSCQVPGISRFSVEVFIR